MKAPVVEFLFHKVAKSDTTSATSNERILQRVTSDFTSSNEQRVNFNEYRATSEKLHLIRIGIKFNLISIQKNIKLLAALVC